MFGVNPSFWLTDNFGKWFHSKHPTVVGPHRVSAVLKVMIWCNPQKLISLWISKNFRERERERAVHESNGLL